MAPPSERGLVRPGQGIQLERRQLASTRDALKTGTYVPDEVSRGRVRDALIAIDSIPADVVKGILHDADRKEFRNAYASIVIERAWPSYNELVKEGTYEIHFDQEGISSLTPVSTAKKPSPVIAEIIAKSNQDVLTYFICQQFSDGKIPDISGNPKKDREYFETFKEQTDLDLFAGSNFRTIPEEAGSPSVFVSSGSLVLRTHIFGLPNVTDAVTQRDGIELTPDQHRNSFERTMSGSIVPYYLPTTSIVLAINSELIDKNTLALKPENWTHNGNPDNLVVYPKPAIVSRVNAAMAKRDDLPIQTNCPAFHSRVTTIDAPEIIMRLPRSLSELALHQLDTWYYPKRRKEYIAQGQ